MRSFLKRLAGGTDTTGAVAEPPLQEKLIAELMNAYDLPDEAWDQLVSPVAFILAEREASKRPYTQLWEAIHAYSEDVTRKDVVLLVENTVKYYTAKPQPDYDQDLSGVHGSLQGWAGYRGPHW